MKRLDEQLEREFHRMERKIHELENKLRLVEKHNIFQFDWERERWMRMRARPPSRRRCGIKISPNLD